MAWRRLEDTFHSDRKIRRLAEELAISEPLAAGHLATLWSWALLHAKDGDLTKFDARDIEHGAKWGGATGDMVAAFIAAGLIDEKPGEGMALHNWLRRGGSYAESQRKRLKDKGNATSSENVQENPGISRKIQPVLGDSETSQDEPQLLHDRVKAPHMDPYVLLHDRVTSRDIEYNEKLKPPENQGNQPDEKASGNFQEFPGKSALEENRIEENIHTLSRMNATESNVKNVKRADEVAEVWNHYRTHHPKASRDLKAGRKEHRLIRDRLDDGFSADDLKQAIDGYHRSAWHRGENDRGRSFLSLTLLLRDVSHVTEGIEMHDPKRNDRAKKILDPDVEFGITLSEGGPDANAR